MSIFDSVKRIGSAEARGMGADEAEAPAASQPLHPNQTPGVMFRGQNLDCIAYGRRMTSRPHRAQVAITSDNVAGD